MKKISRALSALVAVPALMLAGCGADGPSDDPAETTEFFLAALAEGDVTAMCKVYAFRSQAYTGPVDDQHWTQSECEERMWDKYDEHLNNKVFAEVEVGEPEIDGNWATFSAENLKGWPKSKSSGVSLQLFDGKWYVVRAL